MTGTVMMKLKRGTVNGLMVLASLAVGVIVCEAASRFLLKPADYLSPKMIKDRVLGITIGPNSSGYDEWG